jgi:hypothetical protein
VAELQDLHKAALVYHKNLHACCDGIVNSRKCEEEMWDVGLQWHDFNAEFYENLSGG